MSHTICRWTMFEKPPSFRRPLTSHPRTGTSGSYPTLLPYIIGYRPITVEDESLVEQGLSLELAGFISRLSSSSATVLGSGYGESSSMLIIDTHDIKCETNVKNLNVVFS
jgi:hypothetical protein